MKSGHQFGGPWTEEKLSRLRKYLSAYTTIFKGNPMAAKLTTNYVDAFAGTGYRGSPKSLESTLLPLMDEDARNFQKGSAQIALETNPSFHRYLFVDTNINHVRELEKLRNQFPAKADRIEIIQEEANSFLQRWCVETNWRQNRAVVFLDPYGMEVEWPTIKAIATTKAIDLWILFPLGQAVNRLLTRKHPPKDAWADRITKCFGTEKWRKAFYQPQRQSDLFNATNRLEKEADFESIGGFFVKRLETVFEMVAQNPLPLRNSRNIPIYLLCFAASNPKGAPTAVKIASHILRN